ISQMNSLSEKKNFVNLTGYDVNILGFKISGFPYINYINGYWNFEIRNQELLNDMFLERIGKWKKEDSFPDILVTHA
ncbi:hypothetical protein OEK97_28850, partial [Escherichia coli]|uniref:hypothetical protein n=1 Tax=Escherichia coli TaxID=562 RepID=UPI0021DB6DB4